MIRIFANLAFALLLICQFQAGAQLLTLEKKFSDFDQLNASIQSYYGPLRFKQEVMNYDLESIKKAYEVKIGQTKGNRDFYYLLKQYIAEFHDGHFRSRVPTNYVKSLPIATEWVNGEILIDTVDREALPEKLFPFKRGDSVVGVEGIDVFEVVKELKSYRGAGFDLTETRSAARQLFNRRGAIVPVPEGEAVTFAIKSRLDNSIRSYTLNWEETGEPLDENLMPEYKHHFSLQTNRSKEPYGLLSTAADWAETMGMKNVESSYQCSGGTRIKIPEDATMIVEEPFVAYFHATPRGNVGYLRIPHYYWLDDHDPNYSDKILAKYEFAVRELEKNTIGLVIDQDHNCGGSVSYLESMVGLFMNAPYAPLMFELRGTKASYLYGKGYLDELPTDTIAYQQFSSVIELIKKAWTGGDFMTPKTSLSGETTLYPNVLAYTKPILMTIDEMSGSGGDAFPAMMKGFGRAKLLGTRTSGLGGHVNEIPALNFTGLTVDMTMSLFYRPDGVPVENNGAVPDISYFITKEDFLNEYQDYQKFYIKSLLEMID